MKKTYPQSNKKCHFSQEDLLELIRRQNRPMRVDAILRAAQAGRRAKKDIEQALHMLIDEGILTRLPGGGCVPTERLKTVTGRFTQIPGGGGVIEPGQIHISPSNVGNARNNDYVRVVILPIVPMLPGEHVKSGIISAILERSQETIFARVESRHRDSLLCIPVDRSIKSRFRVFTKNRDIKPGALLTLSPQKQISPNLWTGKLKKLFPNDDKVETQEAIVKSEHPVPGEFPQLAISQAQNLGTSPQVNDFEAREDLRDVPFVTIDGEDAKDFDDAIFVEPKKDGWLLRVAIADVSHYVHPDARLGSLDSEAARRGNSWYFPRSVEPMLPKELSNGLCSLKPGEDRLALMAEMTFSATGEAYKPVFKRILMRSAARLTYTQVHDLFKSPHSTQTEDGQISQPLQKMLGNAYSLYKILRQKRQNRGSLDFDLPEPEYHINAKGDLLSIGIAEITDANRLIEEFMIAANEAVAIHLGQCGVPFLYRDHPKPELAKLTALYLSLYNIAPELVPPMIQDLADPCVIQKILQTAKGTPAEYAINRLCLRSMPQARYQPENTGHFGIASQAYCHFTSPIRRYADLITHRALTACLDSSKKSLADYCEHYNNNTLQILGEQLSRREREALECEREMAKRLGCIALSAKVGTSMEGTISGVADFGVFVEFRDIPIEGLISTRDLNGDWFEVDLDKQALVGLHTGQAWRLGQPVRVRVESVNVDRMEIRLIPVDESGREIGTKHKHKNWRNKRKPAKTPNENRTRKTMHCGKRHFR